MKIYTRTGDDGTTGLFGAERVSKGHPRIRAYGTVDEANAAIGMARATLADGGFSTQDLERCDRMLARIQEELFILGGDLSSPAATKYPVPRVEGAHVEQLEREIDDLDRDLAPLKHFVLPGGTRAAAAFHVARTVTRRAERETVDLANDETVSEHVLHYLNRLSDFLFALARWANARAGVGDVEWIPVRRGQADSAG